MVPAVPFMQGKVDTVQYLRSKESESLSWTAVVTGGFTEFVRRLFPCLSCASIKMLTNWSATPASAGL